LKQNDNVNDVCSNVIYSSLCTT